MTFMPKIIMDCLTGPDGVTYDPARVYGAMAVNVFLANSLYATFCTHLPFNYLDFGAGFAALLVAFGAGVALKAKTEPTAVDPGKPQ